MSFKYKQHERRPKRKQIATYLIVCEGTETEYNYFLNFRKRNSGVKIEIPQNKTTDPVGLIDVAYDKITELDINTNEGDKVYCVFDVDNNTDQQIQDAITKATKSKQKIEVIISNPSFELWYLLHLTQTTATQTQKSLISRIESEIKTKYNKSAQLFPQLKDLTKTAVKRSIELNEFLVGNKKTINTRSFNPSTQVHIVVDTLWNVAFQNN